jgi:hypothetical protein
VCAEGNRDYLPLAQNSDFETQILTKSTTVWARVFLTLNSSLASRSQSVDVLMNRYISPADSPRSPSDRHKLSYGTAVVI